MGWSFWFGIGAGMVTLAGAAAAAFVPGPHRLVCPECFGLVRIAPRAFTDAPAAMHADLRTMLIKADRETELFFGSLKSSPRVVMCATDACIARFSRGYAASGVTFGSYLIRIAPRGLYQTVMTHERVHAELYHRVGDVRMIRGAVPTWFDEGLAVLIANDRRFLRNGQGKVPADWTDRARAQSGWMRLVDEHGWRVVYGAATQRVASIEKRVGRDGLRRIIERIISGEDFDTALHTEVVRSGGR